MDKRKGVHSWKCVQYESKEKNANSKKRIMKRKKRDSIGWRRSVT